MPSISNGRTFDWKSHHDPRSREYDVRTLMRGMAPAKKLWTPGPLLDQGPDGACVGFGWSGELAASPVRVAGVNNAFAFGVYNRAKQLDEWVGDDYEGTSVIAGAKACQGMGLIGEYRWAFNIDDLRDAVISLGPSVFGILWKDSMFDPRPSGLLDCSGTEVGGHCMHIIGYHPGIRLWRENWFKRYEVFKLRQSWGPWGIRERGDCYMLLEDMERSLADNGEACIPLQRNRSAA